LRTASLQNQVEAIESAGTHDVTSVGLVIDRVRAQPRRFVAVADTLFVAVLIVAVAAELAVDFKTEILGVPISFKSAWRIVAWALLISAVRHIVVPRPSFLQRVLHEPAAAAHPPSIGDVPLVKRRRAWGALGLLSFFAIATGILLHSQIAQPYAVPDQGDPVFSIWRLAWVAHQLPRDPLRLFEANIFYPHPHTLAYSDAMLVAGLTAAPLLWLGVHQVAAYNVVFFSAIVLSGVTMFILVRYLTGLMGAALVAGLLFAFCAFRFLHYSHLELQITHWMPLALYSVHRTLSTGRLRDGLLAGLIIALQALSSLYYGVYFVTSLVCIVAALWLAGQVRWRRAGVALAGGALLAAAIVVPATIPHWQSRGEVGERDWDTVQTYSARPSDYLVAHERSVYRRWLNSESPGERQLFPGLLPLALTLVALWPPLTPLKFAYGAGLAFAFDASLGFNGEMYHWLYDYVPGVHGFRVPARFAMIVAVFLSVLAGLGVARLLGRIRSPVARVAALLALGATAFVESKPTLTLEPIWKRPPAVYGALPRDRTAVLAEFPFPATEGALADECRFMYFSTFHWHKLLNGNSGFFPPAYDDLRHHMQQFPSDESIAVLRGYGVEFVVVHEKFHEPSQFARVTTALEQRTEFRMVAQDLWEGGLVQMYELRTP
jgi:hypothetical protein